MKTAGLMVDLAHDAMATTFRLRLVAKTETYARQAATAAWDELNRLESLLSRYIDGSDTSRINHAPPGEAVRINADTMQCLKEAQRMAILSGGAFHPMLGAWTSAAPDARPGSISRMGTGISALVLSETALTAARRHEASLLDLGGIGKGFGVDKLIEVLREWEIAGACVDAGGSTIFAIGLAESGSPWQAQLAAHLVPLENAAVAGSGTAVKGLHIVDGRNGERCAQHSRVWSYAPTAAEADALSTAFFAFSEHEIERFCSQHRHYGAACLTPENTLRTFGALRTK